MARFFVALLLPLAAWCGDWDAKLAARYLDGRAGEWAAWKRAAKEGGPCIACHTSLGYLLARPALRRRLGEGSPTEFERGLLAGVKTRVRSTAPDPKKDDTATVLAALVLTLDDQRRGSGLSAETEAALRNLWNSQRREGNDKGAWGWTNAGLEPWEVPESPFFGAALAAVTAGSVLGNYQSRPEIRQNLEDLKAYLRAGRERQPFANRMMLLWAATRMGGLLTDTERREIVDEVWRRQSGDGGWTLAALGPWRMRPDAPPAAPAASNAYATAFAAFLLKQAVFTGDPRLVRALDWLRAHQAPEGFWDAVSMNKRYEPGSIPEQFMRESATAFAVLALSDAN